MNDDLSRAAYEAYHEAKVDSQLSKGIVHLWKRWEALEQDEKDCWQAVVLEIIK